MSLDLDGRDHDPSARETALGPAGAAYRHKGVTVGTDGACKSYGVMGAALATKDAANRLGVLPCMDPRPPFAHGHWASV